jgi:hypothetical protein
MGTQTNGLLSNKRVLCFIMIVLELIWPIVASLLCLQTELRPEYAIQENLAVSEKNVLWISLICTEYNLP